MQVQPDTLEALTDRELSTVEELARQCLEQGAALGDIRGYTADEMDAVYLLAHNAYQQHKYDDARKLFYFLAENDHTESRYWMGLAACLQLTGEHTEAVAAYGMAALLDATNPEPPLRACECYLALRDLAAARKALDAVEFVCQSTGGAQAHAATLKRAALLAAAVAGGGEDRDRNSDHALS